MVPRLFVFRGGNRGAWRVTCLQTVVGDPLPPATHLDIFPAEADGGSAALDATWMLRGITSNERYVTREEKNGLVAVQPGLGRAEALCGALIPIRKSPAWWALPQDERRKIFEEQSKHVRIGMNFLPAIARRLHHCRDLGVNEPFDFLTWFEFAPSETPAFEDLLLQLRASPEWAFVEREVDLRVDRIADIQKAR